MPSDAPVLIAPYDTQWPARFEAERRILVEAIGGWIVDAVIEHIGSTAIPGLAAKPVIDIMAGVESLEDSRPAVAVLERHGYCYAPYRTDVMHWLCKPSPALRTHHLHLVPLGSPLWIEQLAFRDYLRTGDQEERETFLLGLPSLLDSCSCTRVSCRSVAIRSELPQSPEEPRREPAAGQPPVPIRVRLCLSVA